MVDKINNFRIELSNVCNMSKYHLKCPFNLDVEREHLPIKFVEKVIKELSNLGYRNEIGFHTFNEPFQDPRLYYILSYTRELLPDNTILLWTNAMNLTKTLIEDFKEFGNIRYIISVYNQRIFNKIGDFRGTGESFEILDYRSEHNNQDDRLQIYYMPEINLKKKCFAPYHQVIISYQGDVSLCCFDWNRTITFGNIKDSELAGILVSKKMIDAYKNLSNGDRVFDVCKRCCWSR